MNLLKPLFLISFMTLISRVLGFFRDLVIASTFGVSIFTDAFFVSFKIPNLLRRILSDGAFSQAFIPVLIEYKTHKNKKCVQDFIASVLSFMIFVLFFFVILGVFFSRFLISVNAPGFLDSLEKLILSENLLKIMFPYIFFISLSSFFSSILNSWSYFFVPSLSPIFLNISIIIFSVYFSSLFHPAIFSLAWGVIIGGFLQLFYQLPFLKKIDMLVFPKINWKNPGFIRVLKKFIPAFLGNSANQLSFMINTIFSSLLDSGSISWIYYADRLIEFPIGIFGVSLSTILFTSLTKYYKNHQILEYKNLINSSFCLGLIFSIPTSVIFFFLAKPMITVLFQYGKFTNFDVLMTEQVLVYYSFGLIAFILVKILSTVFYSCEKINIPMKISLFTLFLTQLMNPILIFYFKHSGLALSISISGWVNFLLLYRELYKRKMIVFKRNQLIFIFNVILSILVMTSILVLMLKFFPLWSIGSFCNKITRLFFICFVCGIVYLFMLNILGVRFLNLFY